MPVADSWSEWSTWSDCDSSGFQTRARQCILLFPVGSQCTGNTTESQACAVDSNFIPGEISHLLEGFVKSLKVSGLRCSTVPEWSLQIHELKQNLPLVSTRMFLYCVETMCLCRSGVYIKICPMAPSATALSTHCHNILQVSPILLGSRGWVHTASRNSLLFILRGFGTRIIKEKLLSILWFACTKWVLWL